MLCNSDRPKDEILAIKLANECHPLVPPSQKFKYHKKYGTSHHGPLGQTWGRQSGCRAAREAVWGIVNLRSCWGPCNGEENSRHPLGCASIKPATHYSANIRMHCHWFSELAPEQSKSCRKDALRASLENVYPAWIEPVGGRDAKCMLSSDWIHASLLGLRETTPSVTDCLSIKINCSRLLYTQLSVLNDLVQLFSSYEFLKP